MPTARDLHDLSLRELEIEAALPLAKHGRLFRTPWLDEYFRQQPWYRPTGFDAKALTAVERARVEAVRGFIAALTEEELARREKTLRQEAQQSTTHCPRAVVTGGGKGGAPERLAILYLDGDLVLWDLVQRKRRLVDTAVAAWVLREPAFTRDARRLFALKQNTQRDTPGVVAWETQTLERAPLEPCRFGMDAVMYLLAAHGSFLLTAKPTEPNVPTWAVNALDDARHVADLPIPPTERSGAFWADKIVVAADEKHIVGLASDKQAWLWRLAGTVPHAPEPILPSSYGILDLDLAPDGQTVAVLPGWGSQVMLMAVNALTTQRSIALPFHPHYVQLSEDGQLILVGGADVIAVYEVASKRLVWSRKLGSRACSERAQRRATFLRDSRHLAVAGDAGGLKVVDLGTAIEQEISSDGPLWTAKEASIESALIQRARVRADESSLVARSAFPGCPASSTLRRSTDERGIETYACEKASAATAKTRVQHGPTWRWLPTGRLLETHNYDDGREHGPFVVWFRTGARHEDGEFVLGKRQGRHRVFHATGALADDAMYDRDRLDGTRHRGFENGKAALEATYVNGLPNGAWTTFYDNGERALSLVFRDGKPIGNVERFAVDGKPWSATALHEPCGYGCASELGHIDIESLPPIPPEPCRDGVVGTTHALPLSALHPLVAASSKAFDETSECWPGKCISNVTISCAPDLDGKPGGEVLAVIKCRVPRACPDCGTRANVEYSVLAANVVLSPPTAGRSTWTQHGFVSCRENSDYEGYPESKVEGYVRLPDGETAILTVHSAAGGDDGRDRCIRILYGLREGKWQALRSGNRALCQAEAGSEEPEEFDVY